MLTQDFILEMKQRLLDQKTKLEEELRGLNPHVELGDDEDSNAEEIAIDEVSKDLIARIALDLEKIDSSLAKIDAGTYGTDSEGKEISEERLKALPWADKAL